LKYPTEVANPSCLNSTLGASMIQKGLNTKSIDGEAMLNGYNPVTAANPLSGADEGFKSNQVADLNKREGLLYEFSAKIAGMCTTTPEQLAMSPSMATKKNQICSLMPKLVIGNYGGGEVTGNGGSNRAGKGGKSGSAANLEDMEDTGCKDLPLAAEEVFFIFGIMLPAFEPLRFDGGHLCFALLMKEAETSTDENPVWVPDVGTGLLLFSPKLFTGNPLVRNGGGPIGEAVHTVASMIHYVALGVSFGGQTPAIEVKFSNDFWRCDGECKTVKAHLYAAIKLDATAWFAERVKLGDLSVAITAKALVDFDPNRDGFMTGTIARIRDSDGIKDMVTLENVVQFLMELLRQDVAIGFDGQITIGIPLGDWTSGLLRDIDITVGAASLMIRKATVCTTVKIFGGVRHDGYLIWHERQECKPVTGIWGTLTTGGHANTNIMSDIQSNIVNKFDTGPMRSLIGVIGKGIEAFVDVLTSIGLTFEVYFKATCHFSGFSLNGMCMPPAFGIKMKATAFEAYMEMEEDGKVVVCFAIKKLFDSCGNGWENLLMMMRAIGELVVKLVKYVAEAIGKAFDAVGRFLCNLASDFLKVGKVVMNAIGEGFEKAAAQVSEWATEAGEAMVEFAGEAAQAIGNAFEDVGDAVVGVAEDIGDAAEDVADWAEDTFSWRRRRRRRRSRRRSAAEIAASCRQMEAFGIALPPACKPQGKPPPQEVSAFR